MAEYTRSYVCKCLMCLPRQLNLAHTLESMSGVAAVVKLLTSNHVKLESALTAHVSLLIVKRRMAVELRRF